MWSEDRRQAVLVFEERELKHHVKILRMPSDFCTWTNSSKQLVATVTVYSVCVFVLHFLKSRSVLQAVCKFTKYIPTFLMTHRQAEGTSSIRISPFLSPPVKALASWLYRTGRKLTLTSAWSQLTCQGFLQLASYPETTGRCVLAFCSLHNLFP